MIIWVFVILALWAAPTYAEQLDALLTPTPSTGTTGIRSLQWITEKLIIHCQTPRSECVTTIGGRYSRIDWSIVLAPEKINVSDGRFEIKIPVTTKASRIQLFAVGPLGEIERAEYGIYVPAWDVIPKKVAPVDTRKLFLSAGTTVSFISFSDPRVSNYSETVLTGKAVAQYKLGGVQRSSRWLATASCYFTLLPLTQSQDATARFFGFNGILGYALPFVGAPWRVNVAAGVYYTTMFVSNDRFGFNNMSGPQLYPVIQRVFSNRSFLSAYFKFSPVTSGFGVLSLSNREIAYGGGYYLSPRNGRTLGFTVDIASLRGSIDQFWFDSSSISLGVSYGF